MLARNLTPKPLLDILLASPTNYADDLSASLSEDDYASIVLRDLQTLLNTRSNQLLGREILQPTVLEYGLPDWSHISPQSQEATRILANSIQQAVSAFEPRLGHVTCQVLDNMGSQPSVKLRLSARPFWQHTAPAIAIELENDEGGLNAFLPRSSP